MSEQTILNIIHLIIGITLIAMVVTLVLDIWLDYRKRIVYTRIGELHREYSSNGTVFYSVITRINEDGSLYRRYMGKYRWWYLRILQWFLPVKRRSWRNYHRGERL